jgi:hypothetical protein
MVMIDWSTQKKEIGGAPAPKKIKHARGHGLDHQNYKKPSGNGPPSIGNGHWVQQNYGKLSGNGLPGLPSISNGHWVQRNYGKSIGNGPPLLSNCQSLG